MIKQCWAESKWYRAALLFAILYAMARFGAQVYFFAQALTPQALAQDTFAAADLQFAYIPVGEHFRDREDLYLKGSLEVLETHYLDTPVFAFFW